MSLILAGLIAAGAGGAVIVGRWLAKRKDAPNERASSEEDGGDAKPEGEAKAPEAKTAPREEGGGPVKDADDAKKRPMRKAPPDAATTRLEGFPCQLGDVVMRITGEEAWLAGGLVLSEEVPVAALFVAPDAGHDCAIYVRPKPREALYWLMPLDAGEVLVGGEPPSSVEHAGIRFDRARRLPLRPRRVGVGAPDVGDAVVLAEYTSAGAERLLVMKTSTGTARAYRGLEIEAAAYEVIPSGEATLGDG